MYVIQEVLFFQYKFLIDDILIMLYYKPDNLKSIKYIKSLYNN